MAMTHPATDGLEYNERADEDLVAIAKYPDAWLVRANAYTQAATADLMRLRAIDLANSSADIKMGATNTTNLRQQLMNLLQHN